MKILVCIKQVMESGSPIKIDPSGKWLQYSQSTRFEINKYDEYAIEEAIQIKENFKDTQIDVITVGPSHASDVLRRALGMGADEAIHILDEAKGYRPPAITAEWITAFVKKETYDLIFTGIMSDDEMNAQTGVMISQILDWPCATAVIKEEISNDRKKMRIEREIEGGAKDIFDITLPCVLTIQTGINTPRYPSLSKVLRAKKKTLQIIPAKTLKTAEQIPSLETIQFPEKTTRGIVLKGSSQDKAKALLNILASKTLV